jgi:hypothetical protein
LQNSEASGFRLHELAPFHPKEGASLPAHLCVQGFLDLIHYCVRALAQFEVAPHLPDLSDKPIICTPLDCVRQNLIA